LNNAIVFTGQLRCIQNNFEHIQELSLHFSLFFCTSFQDSIELDLITAKKLGTLFFIDLDDECNKEEMKLISLTEGVKILQWQKLWYAFNVLKKDYKFDAVIKLRTDIDFSSGVIKELISQQFTPSTIYMYSDIFFAGKWDDMYTLSLFYNRYADYYELYQPVICFDGFVENDFDAAKFLWLHYPLSISDYVYDLICATEDDKYEQQKILLDKLGLYKESELLIENTSCKQKDYDNVKFSSEGAFLHYILKNSFKVKGLKNQIKLLENRFYDKKKLFMEVNSYNFYNALNLAQWGIGKDTIIFKALYHDCLNDKNILSFTFLAYMSLKKAGVVFELVKRKFTSV
jgi:hypothetical protein